MYSSFGKCNRIGRELGLNRVASGRWVNICNIDVNGIIFGLNHGGMIGYTEGRGMPFEDLLEWNVRYAHSIQLKKQAHDKLRNNPKNKMRRR